MSKTRDNKKKRKAREEAAKAQAQLQPLVQLEPELEPEQASFNTAEPVVADGLTAVNESDTASFAPVAEPAQPPVQPEPEPVRSKTVELVIAASPAAVNGNDSTDFASVSTPEQIKSQSGALFVKAHFDYFEPDCADCTLFDECDKNSCLAVGAIIAEKAASKAAGNAEDEPEFAMADASSQAATSEEPAENVGETATLEVALKLEELSEPILPAARNKC